MNMSPKQFSKMMKGSHAKIRNNVQLPASDLEPGIGNATGREDEVKAFDSPVVVTIHSYRFRLADPDGLAGKWTIDAIVKAGILADDTTEYVEEVRFKQTKIKKPEEERVVVTLQELGD